MRRLNKKVFHLFPNLRKVSTVWIFSSERGAGVAGGSKPTLPRPNEGGTWTVVSTDTPLADGASGDAGAWGDYDGDGDLDLYIGNNFADFATRTGTPNRLFRNDGGRFVDVAAGTPLAGGDTTDSVSWVDYDDDGDLDLYVGNYEVPSRLFRNDGNRFVDVTAETALADYVGVSGAAWGDYDGDGDIDLFVAGIANRGSRLLRNDKGRFTDVAALTPLALKGVNALSPTWGDYDNDGDLDLYVAGGYTNGRNYLFRNDGGNFVDVTDETIGRGGSNSWGAAWVDYDNDGDLDLYVNRGDQRPRDHYANSLYRNDGGGTFVDVAPAVGLADVPGNSECVTWGDYDNDGDLDVYITDHDDKGQSRLFRNDGGIFTDATASTPIGISGWNHAAIFGDYDNDGDLDLYAVVNGVNHLFQNETNNENYLFVRPLSANGGLTCFGAQVRVYDVMTGALVGMQSIDGGSGLHNQNAYDAHFGLDPDRWYDVEVTFVGGRKVTRRNVVPSDLPGHRVVVQASARADNALAHQTDAFH